MHPVRIELDDDRRTATARCHFVVGSMMEHLQLPATVREWDDWRAQGERAHSKVKTRLPPTFLYGARPPMGRGMHTSSSSWWFQTTSVGVGVEM